MPKIQINLRRVRWISWCTASIAVQASLAEIPPPLKSPMALGEVTHQDVYLRSGPSMNHYTISKMNAGDRVTIVSEQPDWYEILPPPGTFSLVSGEFVDSVDDRNGVINAENVRVRAGSTLNDQKYTVQLQLSRGAKVSILGRNADGFVRITPPNGATLWINRSYVEKVPEALLKLEAQGQAPGGTTDARSIHSTNPPSPVGSNQDPGASIVEGNSLPAEGVAHGQPASKDKAAPAPSVRELSGARLVSASKSETVAAPDHSGKESESAASLLPQTEFRKALEDLDNAIRTEQAKELGKRNLEPLIAEYRKIAERASDEITQKYAEARLGQLQNMAELIGAVRRMQQVRDEADAKRKQLMEERANADYQTLPPIATGFDAQGELRTSALYPPGSWPKRYRLIDPQVGEHRTVAYVEIPQDSKIEVDAFLGRYVGVRAVEKRLQVGGVDPIPVFVVRDLVRLQPLVATSAAGP